ncbi:lytic transglycosylase domain-containing protein [Salisaeta longa]|uniref:lytic transglycosylase domain-containing protein n=1 Tax=Salisaeta longa TaxID=503170 RepID=UPI00146EBFFE|nr:lytic transglycosylase domain-containing protein [Salisaeta longa]
MTRRSLVLSTALVGLGALALWNAVAPPAQHPSWHHTGAAVAATADTLSEAQAQAGIEALYTAYTRMLRAEQDARVQAKQHHLRTALQAVERLKRHPGMFDRPRFRQIAYLLAQEYTRQTGAPDTLSFPHGTIYDLRRTLFASMNQAATRYPQLSETLPSGIMGEHTTIPMTKHPLVQASIDFLLRYEERYLRPWQRRAATYFPMIEHIFAAEGVPDELKYLAVVESGLDPFAQSHAKAAGMWQFIAPTARSYGLTVTPWVDERRDPEKATRAAARHLKDLYRLFGDWHLALAGYNCSPRAVQYALRKAQKRLDRPPTFWDIYDDLPKETRNYVPSFIATARILSNPEAYGVTRISAGPAYAFDYVPLRTSLPVQVLAHLANIPTEQVRALNPELRGDYLPPVREAYYLRLPYGTYEQFAQHYQQLPKEVRDAPRTHTLDTGETLGHLARRYQVERAALRPASDADTSVTPFVGQTLTLPAARYITPPGVDGRHRPLRVRYGQRSSRLLQSSHQLAHLSPATDD